MKANGSKLYVKGYEMKARNINWQGAVKEEEANQSSLFGKLQKQINEESRHALFHKYWHLGNVVKQRHFLCHHIKVKSKEQNATPQT